MDKSINTLVGNSTVLKGINRVHIMSCLKNLGPRSRAQLARDTGLDEKKTGNKDFLLMEIEAVIAELLDSVNLNIRRNIKGIGLCVPGLIDQSAGIALRSVNIPCYKDLPIVDIIQKKFSFDTFIETSNRAMALAEMWFGHETSELTNAAEMLIDPLKEVIAHRDKSFFSHPYEIKVSKLGTEANVLGAAMLSLRRFFEFENIQLKNNGTRPSHLAG